MKLSFIIIQFKRSLFLIVLLVLNLYSCRYKEFIPTPAPVGPGTNSITYPLLYKIDPGFTGQITFSKLDDGTSLAELSIIGQRAGRKYYGKISRSNALDGITKSDIADLNEIDNTSGKSRSWVNKDYVNKPILFDSLLVADAMVRVLELDENGRFTEVLRGDIGGNLLTSEVKSYELNQFESSNINGTIAFQRRVNGKYLLKTNFSGLDSNNGNYVLSTYAGDLTLKNHSRLTKVADLPPTSGEYQTSVSGFRQNLDSLELIAGFWGLATSDFRPDSVVSFKNFRGNENTGESIEYEIFKSIEGRSGEFSDTVIGRIKFEERAGGIVRTTFTAINLPREPEHFLTFSNGSVVTQPIKKPFVSIQIPESGVVITDILPYDSSGAQLSFEQIENWDAHLRITTDTLNITSTYGMADLGNNELLDEMRTVNLVPLNGSVCEGTLEIRKRKSGKARARLQLTYREPFTDHVFSLREGSLANASPNDPRLATLIAVEGGNGGNVSVLFDLTIRFVNNTQITYDNLITAGGYFEFAILDGGNDVDRFPLAGGNNQ